LLDRKDKEMQQFDAELEKIFQLTHTNKLRRFLSRPLKYLKAFAIKQLSQRNKKGYVVEAPTFFNIPIQLLLPSGIDIYLFGAKTHDSEIRLTKFLLNHFNSNTVFFDVGAHFGYFSLLAHACKAAHIYSFEASPNNFNLLKKNTESLRNIHLTHAAIYSSIGEIEFYEFPTLYAENNTTKVEQFTASNWLSKNSPIKRLVNSLTLDSFINEHNIIPTIIKIDVEGAELEALKGLKNTLQKIPVTISMEYIFDSNQNSNYAKAFQFIKDLGYTAYLIRQDGSLENLIDIHETGLKNYLQSENIIFQPSHKVE
jgi:FkbM family methyltransferase